MVVGFAGKVNSLLGTLVWKLVISKLPPADFLVPDHPT
jgi:hypothetical protein